MQKKSKKTTSSVSKKKAAYKKSKKTLPSRNTRTTALSQEETLPVHFTATEAESTGSNVDDTSSTEEQTRYGSALHLLSLFGLIYLVITFFLYISGVMKSVIPMEDVNQYWHLKAAEYVQVAARRTGWTWDGWSWIHHLDYGDVISFSGLAFLAAVSIFSVVAVVPIYIRKKDWIFAGIAGLQFLVLVAAAAGVI